MSCSVSHGLVRHQRFWSSAETFVITSCIQLLVCVAQGNVVKHDFWINPTAYKSQLSNYSKKA